MKKGMTARLRGRLCHRDTLVEARASVIDRENVLESITFWQGANHIKMEVGKSLVRDWKLANLRFYLARNRTLAGMTRLDKLVNT